MNTTTGQGRVDIDVVDISTLIAQILKGVVAVQGVTQLGEINKPLLVGSWPEYQRKFGSITTPTNSIFPLLCKRALEAGAKLRINRVGHYTDITDKTTLTADKATATVTGGLKFEAIGEGEGYNGIKVTMSYPKLSPATTVDITVDLTTVGGGTITRNFPRTFTQTDLDTFNAGLGYVKALLTGSTNPITAVDESTDPAVTATLAGGDYDEELITEADYIGDSVAGTGLHAFNEFNDFTRVAVPSIATPTMDDAVLAYAVGRKDVRAWVRTPVGLDSDAIADYRMRTGTYAGQGTRPDTWYGSMTTGGLSIIHPVSGQTVQIPELMDVLAAASVKDTKIAEWFSTAGPKRGRISNALGVVYNLGVSARQVDADFIDNIGVNAVIDDETYGPTYWGDSTLQIASTLLRKENVAELLIFMTRALRPVVRKYLFDPNDIDTWKALYRNVRPIMETLKDNRAIWDYVYLGDQDAETLDDLTINSPDNIDAGVYKLILGIKPKVNMKYINMQIAVTNSGVDFSVLQEPIV